ncbi:hypothetical protein [Natrinema sp. CGMCC1.2065]|uniref:hypothetical protein n=1 Tax=Natrinema sp. CGMCC1.2065 TaxID=3445767 RepID=UPI003F4A37B0
MRLSTRRRKAGSNGSNRIMSLLATFVAMLSMAQAWLKSAYRVQLRRAQSKYPTKSESAIVRAAQAGTVITVVVIGVVAMVGVLIFAQTEQAMPSVDGPLNDSLTSITQGFGDSMEFVPIIMIVLLASVVIAVVQRMRA